MWDRKGALGGGSPMSHVDFKKWQCRMSLSLIFLNVTCRISEKAMSHVTTFLPLMLYVTKSYVAC